MLALGSASAQARIGLEFRPGHQRVGAGDVVRVQLYVVSDLSGEDQSLSAAEVIITWDRAVLELLGTDDTGGAGLISSGFPVPDPYGLNEADPPADGDGIYVALARLGEPVQATPQGRLLTTLLFRALMVAGSTPVEIIPEAGDPLGRTHVFSGDVPSLDVTGTLSGQTVTVAPACDGDLHTDGTLDVLDFFAFLVAFQAGCG